MEKIRRFASKLNRSGIEWFRKNVFFSWQALFVSGLVFSHSFVDHAVVSILITYLTDTDNFHNTNLRHAATIVNCQEAATIIIGLPISWISNTHFRGCFFTIAVANVCYIVGMVLLWQADRFKPITSTVAVLIFYIAIVLITLGKAGEERILTEFLADQLCEQEQNPEVDEGKAAARARVWWRVFWFLGATPPVFIPTKISWILTFQISTVVMGVGYIFFGAGIPSWAGLGYYYKQPEGSFLNTIFAVFKAAISKWRLDYPDTATLFYKNDNDQLRLLPDIPYFGCNALSPSL